MDANTEYWQDRLQQLEFDYEVECERLKVRIAALEDTLAAICDVVKERNQGYRDRKHGDVLNKQCADQIATMLGVRWE